MPDLPRYPDSNSHTAHGTGVGSVCASTTSAQRRVRVLGIIALALIPLFFIVHITGVGGLRSHAPS